MISTISDKQFWIFIGLVAAVAILSVEITVEVTAASPVSAKNRVPTLPATAVAPPRQEANAEDQTAIDQAKKQQEAKKERPYYGSAYFNELLTSAYYYPNGGDFQGSPDEASTHLKFNHREDDLYLCGDQRSKFEPGKTYILVVTFEPNHDCATNWKLK